MTELPLVLAMTGASGAGFAIRLLQCLRHAGIPVQLTYSDAALQVLRTELGLRIESCETEFRPELFGLDGDAPWWQRLSDSPPPDLAPQVQPQAPVEVYAVNDLSSPIASGSHLTRGMIICPCSGNTLSAVARAAASNLIHRAADVHLKERRPLVLVTRETPLSTPQLENMAAVSRFGATVLPASPGWYHGVRSIYDLIDFIVARILDQFRIPHQLTSRWGTLAKEE
ncbi:MAG: flavin prenyltransferase UbiX [Pirellulaceae bacterium]